MDAIPTPSRLKRAARFALLLVAFSAGFAAVSTSFRYVADLLGLFANVVSVSKPREAAERRADVIFVGPSHLLTGIMPEVFDAEMSKYVKVRSYNMSVGGLTVPEIDFLLKRRFAMDTCCVQYVLFYPGFMMSEIARSNSGMRSIDYFNTANAARFWSFVREYKPAPPPGDKSLLEYAGNIAASTFRHYTHLGLGLVLLGVTQPRQQALADATGFVPLNGVVPEHASESWRSAVEQMKAPGPGSGPVISDRMFAEVVSIIDTIERHGARAIVVRPPSTAWWAYDRAFVRKYREDCADGPPLLDFDPASYPQLYEGANHHDAAHLNVTGATIWSRILADHVGELIRSGRLKEPSFCAAGKE